MTFTRRRLALLEWLEENVVPDSFLEEPDRVGVAMVSLDLRIEVERAKMTIHSAAETGPDIAAISDVLGGIFEVLEPVDVRVSSHSSVWSQPLDSTDYNESRARFAQRVGLGSATESGFRAFDASALCDVQSPEWAGQIEYGVVEPAELLYRLERPGVGRLGPEETRWSHLHTLPIEDDLPPVSVLMDGYLTRRAGGTVSEPSDVIASITGSAGAAAELFAAAMETFRREGGSGEFAKAE